MPTYDLLDRFLADFDTLSPEQQQRFRRAVDAFVEDLTEGRRFRAGLRVKRVRGSAGVYEMTWAPNGRATFQFGDPLRPGEAHVVWRRVGTHDIFGRP